MLQSLKQRIYLSVLFTVLAAGCGALAGHLLGRMVVLNQEQAKLKQNVKAGYDALLLYTLEAHKVLGKMNASAETPCSQEDLRSLNHLVFESHYVKEAGRFRGDLMDCSTTLGTEHLPSASLKPDFTQADGTRLYRNLPGLTLEDSGSMALRLKDSYVLMNPYTMAQMGTFGPHLEIRIRDAVSKRSSPVEGGQDSEGNPDLSRDGDLHTGGSLYSTICSPVNHTCMTALESEAEALQLNRPQMTVYTLSGVLTGGLLGLLFAAMYRRNQSIEQQLRRAIENDELRVVYQPVVEMATGRIVGAEALARWTDDHGLVVSPEIFVQIAENLGFVQEITRLVIRRTLQDFQGTMRRSPEFGVHVNITSADLSDAGFLPMLEGAVKAAEVTSRNLMMEITESSTVHFERAIEAIRQLRQKGYAVYIDDFGTGYSSLAYLHRLSIDAIKIDRSFVQAIGTDAVTVSILPLILSAAEQLNLNVVVEGVETREQADYFLTSKRPMRAQGWLYGRPVAAEEFLRLLGENERG